MKMKKLSRNNLCRQPVQQAMELVPVNKEWKENLSYFADPQEHLENKTMVLLQLVNY